MLLRALEEAVCICFILDMTMAQAYIFPWFFELHNSRMVINTRWLEDVGIESGDCSKSARAFFEIVHTDDPETP